jgi:hypothetical protein
VEFLNPFALLAMAAVAVPLFLHLFNFRRPRTVDFSSLEFVKELQKSAVQRVRIKEWLLLALRMLAIACLVMAFARPTLPGAFTVGDRQVRTAHALVIDNSLSMSLRDGQERQIDRARQRALGVLETVETDDDVLVWPTARQGDGVPSPVQNRAVARQAVEQVEPRAGASTLARAVARAAGRLGESTAPRKVVYVASDLQASAIGDSLETEVEEGIQVVLLPTEARAPANVAITDARVVSRVAEVGQPVRLEATLVNHGSEPLEGYVASVYLQDERVAQTTATLEPDQETTVTFTATPRTRGWLAGRIEIEDDTFTPDDTRHFTLHVPKERRLLLVRGEGQETRYVDLALSSEMIADRIAFRTERIDEGALPSTELGSYDTVLLVGPRSLSSGEVSALVRYVDRGGGLLLFPSSQAQPDDYNALIEGLGGGALQGFSGSVGGDRSIASFDRVDLEHPLFEGVFDRSSGRGETQVESPAVYYAATYRPAGPREQTLVELSNGTPFLQEIRHGSGASLLLAVAPMPTWSDLPVRGLFIPLLYRSVYYLSAGTSVAGEQLVAGRSGELRITGLEPGTPLRLVGPEGVERSPEQRTLYGATLLETGATLHTLGIYDVRAGDQTVRRVAVNLDARESDLAPAGAADAAETLARATGTSVQPLEVGDGAPSTVAETLRTRRAGTEVWNVFLALALAFLVTEMVVAGQWKPERAAA